MTKRGLDEGWLGLGDAAGAGDFEREVARMQSRLTEALLEGQQLKNDEQREHVRKAKAEADLAEDMLAYWRKQLALPAVNVKGEGNA